ncbi:hypothetical protein JD969_09295 [Planctomycetota bacterium]|nr:hypothetical protein JD969_09295 [Planctomycetota bacterium]
MCATNSKLTNNQNKTTTQAQSQLSHRFNNLTPWNVLNQIRIRIGTMADYHALSHFHYRSARPGAPTRILVMEHISTQKRNQTNNSDLASLSHVTTSTAYRALKAPTNSSATKTRAQSIVGVLVESLPALSCSLRDYALDRRYCSPLSLRQRAKLLNKEMRCISRVVIHPQYRGLSLAVHLVQHALTTATTRFTESLAAMGQVNPFFERAGMTPYVRSPHEHDARLTAALQTLNITQTDLVRAQHAANLIKNLPTPEKTWITSELSRWHRHYVRTAHKNEAISTAADHTNPHNKQSQLLTSSHLQTMLDLARKRLFFKPMYYLHINQSATPLTMQDTQNHTPTNPTLAHRSPLNSTHSTTPPARTETTPIQTGYPTSGNKCGSLVNTVA